MTGDLERLLATSSPPAPAESLRERTLSAALAAARGGAPRPSAVDRIWDSNALRWAWLVLVSGLALGHAAMREEGRPFAPLPQATAMNRPARGAPDALNVLDAMLDPTLGGSVQALP